MEIKFSVSELSRITGISGRNIRYYDSVGLLKPTGIHENGYRYYTIDKIEELNIISHLRHLGLPIAQVKTHMQKKDLNAYGDILSSQLKKLDAELEHLKKIRHNLDRRISSLNEVQKFSNLDEITLCHLPERKVYRMDCPIETESQWIEAISRFTKENKLKGGIFIGDLGFLIDVKKIHSRKEDEFSGIYYLVDEHLSVGKATEVFPEGQWLVSYIQGNHTTAMAYYPKMIAYAEANELELGTFASERMLFDHFISSDTDHHITEIMIPCSRKM